MCYSVRTSMVSFTIGMAAGLYALWKQKYVLGMLILTYSQIQLAEALIWTGIDRGDEQLNRAGTRYAKYMLPAHVIGLGVGVMWWSHTTYGFIRAVDYIPLLLGVVLYATVMLDYYLHPDTVGEVTYPRDRECMSRACQNNNNRLVWPFPQQWYVLTYLLCLVLLRVYLPRESFLVVMGFFTLTYVVSLAVNHWTASSLWCFSAAILAPLMVGATIYVNP